MSRDHLTTADVAETDVAGTLTIRSVEHRIRKPDAFAYEQVMEAEDAQAESQRIMDLKDPKATPEQRAAARKLANTALRLMYRAAGRLVVGMTPEQVRGSESEHGLDAVTVARIIAIASGAVGRVKAATAPKAEAVTTSSTSRRSGKSRSSSGGSRAGAAGASATSPPTPTT
jgi:hypothetical protein